MDFSRRDGQTNQAVGVHHAETPTHRGGRGKRGMSWIALGTVLLLFSVVVLIAAVIVTLLWGGTKSESKYVDNNKLQAVFLNGGQVYFGNISTVNDKFMTLKNIYYLRVSQQVQPPSSKQQASNNVSLVKLGCELHGPDDQMVINRDQIIFWENLKSDGQVAKAVATYVKQNPNGQQCNTTTSNSSSTPTTGQ